MESEEIEVEEFKKFLYIGRIKGNEYTPYQGIVSGYITYGDMFVKGVEEEDYELFVYYTDERKGDKFRYCFITIPKEKHEKGETYYVEVRNKSELSLEMFKYITSPLDIIKEFFTVKEINKYEVKPKWVD